MSANRSNVAHLEDFNVKSRLLDLDFFLLCTALALFGNAMLELTGYKLY